MEHRRKEYGELSVSEVTRLRVLERENAKEFLRAHPEIADSIEAQIRAAMTPAAPGSLEADATADDDTLDDEE